MAFTEQQIESISPNPAAFQAGKKLSAKSNWESFFKNERAIWGAIRGSGKSPYLTQIDLASVAYKCTCPSRQFPCKHSIGLMLLHVQAAADFTVAEEEPEWVKTWLDKRQTKEQKPEPKEKTEEELEKLEKNREKTQAVRIDTVKAGIAELELWLKDLVRIGFLELPNKPRTEFEKVAARMVDAKAPALAGWVKAFTKLNFENQQEWQTEALKITSKLFLLIRTFRSYDNLSPLWQITVKNLVGWSQSTKELLADNEAETVKDKWLVVGQEVEVNDDITIQRNWLMGCVTNRKALILNFATKFSSFETNLLPGSIMEAELAFFPSVLPHRAAVKIQRKVLNELTELPPFFDSWNNVLEHKTELLKINPWANDFVILLKNARLHNSNNQWIICDNSKTYLPVIKVFDIQKIMKWLVLSGNRAQDIACVLRNNEVLPLGVFQNNQYTLL